MPMPGMQTTTIGERVIVRRTCPWCYKEATIEVGRDAFNEWVAGKYVQDVWPSFSAGQREILVSGTHPECWDLMWAE